MSQSCNPSRSGSVVPKVSISRHRLPVWSGTRAHTTTSAWPTSMPGTAFDQLLHLRFSGQPILPSTTTRAACRKARPVSESDGRARRHPRRTESADSGHQDEASVSAGGPTSISWSAGARRGGHGNRSDAGEAVSGALANIATLCYQSSERLFTGGESGGGR